MKLFLRLSSGMITGGHSNYAARDSAERRWHNGSIHPQRYRADSPLCLAVSYIIQKLQNVSMAYTHFDGFYPLKQTYVNITPQWPHPLKFLFAHCDQLILYRDIRLIDGNPYFVLTSANFCVRYVNETPKDALMQQNSVSKCTAAAGVRGSDEQKRNAAE